MEADKKSVVVRLSIVLTLFLSSGAYLAWALMGDASGGHNSDRPRNIDAKRAINGHTVKFKPDGKLTYAGIRAPYEDESFFEEAKARNDELVHGKELRLRFDGDPPEREDRVVAWAFDGDTLLNEVLVREGLAYVRLTAKQQRFGDRLLEAQLDAQSARRGLWGLEPPPLESQYSADPKYGNFHRPSCDEVRKINQTRIISLESREDAFHRGFAPCDRCRP
ncbi:MAG: thermonuclease family protein [Phycisphaerales bacterium]|nr:thermonuclease family protein [Phycisphaerales bacterium]